MKWHKNLLAVSLFLAMLSAYAASPAMQDGLYLKNGEKIVRNEFIPIVLSQDPEKKKDARGHTELLIELAPEQAERLKDFTTKHVNESIAIVIDGKVVSSHKIREPITSGKLQISRCTDNKCDVIYTQLQKKLAEQKK